MLTAHSAPAFGGGEPSRIIDPGELLRIEFRYGEYAGARLIGILESQYHEMRGAIAYSIAAFGEVSKFIPAEQDSVPAEAFTSERGRKLYLHDPEKFSRRLVALYLGDARAVLADVDEVTPPPPAGSVSVPPPGRTWTGTP